MITPTTKCSHDPLRHYLPCAGCAQDEIAALRSRVEVLTTALTKHASQGLAPDGLCWCFYVRVCHPEDDPQDSVETRDGHTEDCCEPAPPCRPERRGRRDGRTKWVT